MHTAFTGRPDTPLPTFMLQMIFSRSMGEDLNDKPNTNMIDETTNHPVLNFFES